MTGRILENTFLKSFKDSFNLSGLVGYSNNFFHSFKDIFLRYHDKKNAQREAFVF